MEALMREAGELLAITVASIKTARKSKNLSRRGTNIGQVFALNPKSEIRNSRWIASFFISIWMLFLSR
jgi:hypothetical protein